MAHNTLVIEESIQHYFRLCCTLGMPFSVVVRKGNSIVMIDA